MGFTTLAALAAHHKPTAAELAAYKAAIEELRPLWAQKTSDTTITSDNTLNNDAELFVSVAANTTYRFRAHLFYTSSEAADMQVTFTFPTGATMHYGVVAGHPDDTGFNSGGTNGNVEFYSLTNQTSPAAASGIAGSTGKLHALIEGVLVVGATSGTLQLQWAQIASTAVNTTVYAGSSLEARKVA